MWEDPFGHFGEQPRGKLRQREVRVHAGKHGAAEQVFLNEVLAVDDRPIQRQQAEAEPHAPSEKENRPDGGPPARGEEGLCGGSLNVSRHGL